ncbi:MAG: cache domain-containing protein [Deltaproteobacteria bacterium]|nr:cache domain-containing protein [Deltaproteobacteria bacterium]
MKLTIYRKLLLSILPIVGISILGIGYYSYLVAKEETSKQIGRKIQRVAEDMAGEVNRLCSQAKIDLMTISEITSIGDYYNNKEYRLDNEAEVCRKSIEKFMFDYCRRSTMYSGASLIDGNGEEVVKIRGDEVGRKRRNAKNTALFENTRRLKPGEIYRGNVEREDEQGGYVLRHGIPIFSEIGEFKGIVTLALDFDMIYQWIESKKIEKTGYAYLINDQRLLMTPPGSGGVLTPFSGAELKAITEKMAGGAKGWEKHTIGDQEHLIGYAPVDALGWSMGVTVPYADFLGRINDIKFNSALTIIFTILLANVGIAVIAVRISKPIKRLVLHTKLLSEGKFDKKIEATSTDEVGDLAKAFNEMGGKIKSSQEEIARWNWELEERVVTTAGELKAEKEKLEGVFLSMADAVIVLDKISVVVDVNPAAERLLGTIKTDLIGHQVLLDSKAGGTVNPGLKNLQAVCGPRLPDKDIVKCQDFFNCNKIECPAFQSDEYRCWLLPGTLCREASHSPSENASGIKNCSNCPLFIQVQGKHIPVKQTEAREVTLDGLSRTVRVFRTPMFDGRRQFIGNVFVLQDITKDKELDQMKSSELP